MPRKKHHNTTFTCQSHNAADRNYRAAKLLLQVKYAPKVKICCFFETCMNLRWLVNPSRSHGKDYDIRLEGRKNAI